MKVRVRMEVCRWDQTEAGGLGWKRFQRAEPRGWDSYLMITYDSWATREAPMSKLVKTGLGGYRSLPLGHLYSLLSRMEPLTQLAFRPAAPECS